MACIKTTRRLFNTLLDHLDRPRSIGLCGIHPRMLRHLSEELIKPLCRIYTPSWIVGKDPDNCGLANVTPTHKKCCKEYPGNYRPIRLASVLAKAMER